MPSTPHSFPLPPRDADGKPVSVGDVVVVLSVNSCLSELPREDVDRLRRIEGEKRRVVMLDSSGFAWLSFTSERQESPDFCLFPTELRLA
jgi:hypothetical protein